MKRSVQTRAVGPPFRYKHYGQPPKEPVGGYKQARLTPSNPAFAFLVQAIRDGRIKLDEPPHEIYNAHPQLYIIRPKKFLKFLEGAIEKAQEPALPGSPSNSLLTPNSSAQSFSGASFLVPTVPSPPVSQASPQNKSMKSVISLTEQLDKMDLRPAADDNARPCACAAGKNVQVDASGMPIYAEPFLTFDEASSSEHQQMSCEHYHVDVDNETAAVVVVPPAGMNASNVALRLSPVCDRTVMMMTDKGNLASPKDLSKAFTSGSHEVRVGNSTVYPQLRLSRQDALVVALTSKVQQVHGQRARSFKSSKAFQPFKFKRPVKPKLEARPATNEVELPAKSDLVPAEDIVPHGGAVKGVHVLVFFVKYSDCDEHELNYTSSDEEVKPR